ncbi:class II histocompatibility antigen, B-L beta chain-like, partial [Numida meleagris]|uniref:class II histocompatibility antigen, B-L beta chain-like n=1 Tax=Numida meleagris TaxID=8996 RepID=UPI000B3D9A82
AAFFQWSAAVECHFLNGTERVRFVARHVYNRQQYVHFDSDVGLFVADTALGESSAKLFNSQPDVLEKNRAAAEMLCAYNYETVAPWTLHRRAEPKVRVSALRSGSAPRTDRLACYVTGFYPPEIRVKWFRNGREETERVVSTDVIQNGDWTYQVLAVLESGPRRGDTYACHVEHASLRRPIVRPWEPPVDAGRSKMLAGAGGFVLGFVCLALGLFIFVRSEEGRRDPTRPGMRDEQLPHAAAPPAQPARPGPELGLGRAGTALPPAAVFPAAAAAPAPSPSPEELAAMLTPGSSQFLAMLTP